MLVLLLGAANGDELRVIGGNCLGAAAGADVKVDIPIRFADTAGTAREQVVSVSAALAAGVVRKPAELRLFDEAGGCVSADTRVLSSHPDGSVRRAMLRFPMSVQADKTRVLRLTLDATPQPDAKPLAAQATDGSWQ